MNLSSLTPENQALCLANIENGVKTLKAYLAENLEAKENVPEIPETGLAVLQPLSAASYMSAMSAQNVGAIG